MSARDYLRRVERAERAAEAKRRLPSAFPFAPLEVAARKGRPAHRPDEECPCTGDGTGRRLCCSHRMIADELDINVRQFYRLRESGLTVEQADRFAIVLDLHPSLIWDGWWLDEDLAA